MWSTSIFNKFVLSKYLFILININVNGVLINYYFLNIYCNCIYVICYLRQYYVQYNQLHYEWFAWSFGGVNGKYYYY